MRCKSCGYDLRDLGEDRCPECGRPFDPEQSGTFLSHPMNGLQSLRVAILGAVLLSVAPLLSLSTFPGPSPSGVRLVILMLGPGLLVAAFAIESVVLASTGMVLLKRYQWVTHRKAFMLSFLISLAVIASFVVLTVTIAL